MKFNIIGVSRGSQYSPNHIGNDAAIFNLVTEHLRGKGCDIVMYSEAEFINLDMQKVNLLFNMARDIRTIEKLKKTEDSGTIVVNSAYGIQNCTREKMTRLLIANNIPHPQSVIVKTDEPLPVNFGFCDEGCWVKRGDFHAIHREDVTYTQEQEETESVLNEYALRGIKTAVINKHLKGDLLKFYGVFGTEFFHWFYPGSLNHSKFGLEKINGEAKGIPFDLSSLKETCNKAAQTLNVDIYGGDAIVSSDGTLKIIDFNDWPSFAPCRTEAAPSIAQCIYEKISTPMHELISSLQ